MNRIHRRDGGGKSRFDHPSGLPSALRLRLEESLRVEDERLTAERLGALPVTRKSENAIALPVKQCNETMFD
jgi:hypothetical protein